MLVQAVDEFFYKNPTFHFPLGIVMFRDDRCQVAVRRGKASYATCRSRAGQVLLKNGFIARLLEGEIQDSLFEGSLAEAYIFDFEPRAKIPGPIEWEARVERPAYLDPCFGFKTKFSVAEMSEYIVNNAENPLLHRALLGEWDESRRPLVKRRLLKQVPPFSDSVSTGTFGYGIKWVRNVIEEAAPDETFSVP